MSVWIYDLTDDQLDRALNLARAVLGTNQGDPA